MGKVKILSVRLSTHQNCVDNLYNAQERGCPYIQNNEWKHLYDHDENGWATRTVKLLVQVVTPQLLIDILENAYRDNKLIVYVDAGFPDEGGILLADFGTYFDEIKIVEENYRNLGVTYACFF